MEATWALLPVKSLDRAKSRLAGALDEHERTTLAHCLLRKTIAVLQAAHGIDAIAIITGDAAARELARETGCRWLADNASLGLSGNLDAAMAVLAAEGAHTAVIVPADLPLLTAADIDALLAAHAQGITIVPATADGGTNALAMTPPGVVPCRFGADSARRHLEAAREQGVAACCLAPAPGLLAGFARDLDTVDDVRWLCEQSAGGEARRYLEDSGICTRLQAHD